MMNIYVFIFLLLPFLGMIGALVVLARDRRVHPGERRSGLR
ncbi:hypothetical protein [Tunturiibacter gelidoferens]|uniref:Uncharacterized protein n=2 Tax=Tunturiibacter TaxID=3154218 RepID=A0A7Y9NQR1_9BACT|nr:hypothetical protein [Edaphobacter lichenicola]MBB5341172.1 hypothetical protein [Edaphobacter lichenicola]NYF53821.1 hypothetical protein [Edaphobacter lichenicola]